MDNLNSWPSPSIEVIQCRKHIQTSRLEKERSISKKKLPVLYFFSRKAYLLSDVLTKNIFACITLTSIKKTFSVGKKKGTQ